MNISHTRREFLQWSALLLARAEFAQKISANRVTTFVGTGARGAAAEGDTADKAQINNPFHVVIGPDGSMYFSDFGTSRVFRLDFRTSKLSIVAGTGTKGFSGDGGPAKPFVRSEEHTSELQSQSNLVCRLLLEKKKNIQ